MTNKELFRQAVRLGAPTGEEMLRAVQTATRCAPPRRTPQLPPAREWLGWVCAACAFVLILFGYFNGNITLMPQNDQLAGAGITAAAPPPETAQEAPPKTLHNTAPALAGALPKPPHAAAQNATAPQAPAWDGWVNTSPAPAAPAKAEADAGTGGNGWYTYAPEFPPNKKPDDEKPGNPDTGGGGGELTATYPFVEFSKNPLYALYLPTYLPESWAPLPLVEVYSNSYVEITYAGGNKKKQIVLTLLDFVSNRQARGGQNTQGFPVISRKEELTEAHLRELDTAAKPPQGERDSIFLALSLQNKQSILFQASGITHGQAAQILQSLPVWAP